MRSAIRHPSPPRGHSRRPVRSMRSRLVSIIGLAFVFITSLVWVAGANINTTLLPDSKDELTHLGGSSLKVLNPRFSGILPDHVSYILTASEARQDPDSSSVVFFRSVTASLTFLDNEGEWIVLTADNGYYDRNNDLFFLNGIVRVRTAQGYEGEAENLYFMPNDGYAWSDSDIRLNIAGLEVRTRHFDLNHRSLNALTAK